MTWRGETDGEDAAAAVGGEAARADAAAGEGGFGWLTDEAG